MCRVLHEPFWYGREGEEATDERPACRNSAFAEIDGALVSHYVRKNITSGQTIAHVPKLHAEQEAALDLFDSILADSRLAYRMTFEPEDF